MDYELPTEFDLIVVGTGVVESIISAAASRVGKSVLHIDNNNYYGGQWASFNLDTLQNLNTSNQQQIDDIRRDAGEFLEKDEKIYELGNDIYKLKDFVTEWNCPEKELKSEEITEPNTNKLVDDDGNDKNWTQEELLKNSRKFNIDLTPKLQFARGDFVELLISSNIARYSEYRSVSRVLTWLNDQLEIVPCSRSDVFANNKVTVIEKRMLMKLFTSLDLNENELNDLQLNHKTFQQFLKEKKLTPNLIHYVLYAIAMCSTDDATCLQGIQNTKRFLNSLGRFGKTPFLFSMYGSGEITQAFCRLSAVFGGIYALNQPLHGIIFTNNGVGDNFKSLICGKQKITAEHLVIGIDKISNKLINTTPPPPIKSCISRAIFITNKSIMVDDKEHLTLLIYPPENGKNLCHLLELGSLTGTCPKDLYIVHLIMRQITNPKEDFHYCINNLFNFNNGDSDAVVKPKVLWSCYFSIPDTNDLDLKTNNNVFICPGPDLDLDYDFSIKKAKDIFNELYPDLEFLPRAPDPEDIIIESDNDNETPQQQQTITDEMEKITIN